MLRAHKIELKINNKQATYFARASGVARKAYNWGLEEWEKEYKAGGKPTETALRRKLNSIKREQFPWMLEVTKNAPQMAIIQLGQAFKNFFAKRASYPTFRKRGRDDRFTLTNDQFSVNDSRIRIPHLGWVRMRESLRFIGKIISATVSRRAHKWFVSITVDTKDKETPYVNDNQVAVGVDLGVLQFATLSTGRVIDGPKPHKQLLNRLKRLSKNLTRKKKGSHNRRKAQLKLGKLHYRIACIRQDSIHKLTTDLTRNFKIIGIEDLNVKGMMRNRRLSRSISDMGFYEFRRQLEYKASLYDSAVVVANRWFASTKTCWKCGYKMEKLSLSIREWQCSSCNTLHQRDLTASINLEKWAVSSTVRANSAMQGDNAHACGASSDGMGSLDPISHAALKQESNTEFSMA
jgi:putative transposase